jgi:hypothetical protein
LLQHYLAFEQGMLTDAMTQFAPIAVALLGVVVTVVAIIVQLAAGRFTGVARLFMRDRINRWIMGYYVVTGIGGLWLSVSLHQNFMPRGLLLLGLITASLGLLMMLPYFGYVFRFLEPANLVRRIQLDTTTAARDGVACIDAPLRASQQAAVVAGLAELADIVSNSISGKDKIIASRAVDAMRDFALDYLELRRQATPSWFEIGPHISGNPDFVALDHASRVDIEEQCTWVEWQVLRQYLGLYNEALATMRDINYVVAIDTRYLGEAAIRARQPQLINLVLRYFNSYLRSTLNARDVRTAYNVLNQYRLLAEALLLQQYGALALQAAEYMIYYGHVSFDLSLTFVTETVAYDLATLCQAAHTLRVPEEGRMLGYFLELDRPLRTKNQERALLGVRKAQTKLATYYLSVGEVQLATQIAQDMKDEPAERLAHVQSALARAQDRDFWEVTDRGQNFEFMPPEQRDKLDEFFGLIALAQKWAARHPT